MIEQEHEATRPGRAHQNGNGAQDHNDEPLPSRLLVGQGADAQLAEAALQLRRSLAEEYGADTVHKRLLADGAASSFYLQQKLASMTATVANLVERELFADEQRLTILDLSQVTAGFGIQRLTEQLQLLELADRLSRRSIQALREAAESGAFSGKEPDQLRGARTRSVS